ncbi:hypothetical protein T265_08321 [Opisthorchis viverrini]|uniref:Uncharacterized protein n=1 Tax=Opisthorchis viverrini TaxID=6198 RepID=A0A074ZE26_OPIVI|nr:hypothetical protein T265_08321 [Opisthorchis viverrini]KER23902.1 hypothetical protein T265_08321 [Opisthorchis viverrini]
MAQVVRARRSGRSVVRTRPLFSDFSCLGLGNLAVSRPSCSLRVARQLTETRGLRLPDEPQEGRNRSWAVEEFSATLIARLTEENRKLLQQMSELQRQSVTSNNTATYNGNVIQPNLRAFVDSLENELFEERTNSARQAAQHRYELQRLRTDLDAAYASQRSLYERIDQLTTELKLIKRNGGCRSFSSDRFNRRSCSLDLRDGNSSNFLRRSISPFVHASRRTGSVSPSYHRPSASPVSQTHRYMLATSSGSHFTSRANSAFSPTARPRRLSSSERQYQVACSVTACPLA